MKIGIDAAHGGAATGPRGCGRLARDDNLALALEVARALESQGVETVMARRGDVFVSDAARAALYNESGADLVLSFDRGASNGAGGAAEERGFAIWIASRSTPREAALFGMVENALAGVAGTMAQGTFRGYPQNPLGDFKINKGTKAPSMLVKLLHITSEDDNALFDEKLGEYAEAVAKGVCEAFGLAYMPPAAAKKAGRKKTEEDVEGGNAQAE